MTRPSITGRCRTLAAGSLALLAVVAAVAPARAEAPPPFAKVPGDAELLFRLDLAALGSAPAFAGIVEALQANAPNYTTGLLATLGKGDPGINKLAEAYPGTVEVYEFAADLDAMDMTTTESPFYALVHGTLDRAAADTALTSGTWANVAPLDEPPLYQATGNEKMFVGTPSDSTLAMATSPEMLRTLSAMVAGKAPAGTASVADGPLGALIGSQGRAPLMIAFHLTPELRDQLAAASATPPQESFMIAGLPEAIKEGANLTSGAVSLGGTDSASLDIALAFADEGAASRALAALNKAIPAAAALGKMQAGQDPQALAAIEQYEQLRFAGTGSTISLSLPIPQEAMDMAGPMLAQQLQQSAQAFGGASQGLDMDQPAAFDDPNAPITIELPEEGSSLGEPTSDAGQAMTTSEIDADIKARGAALAAGLIPADKREVFPITNVADIDGDTFSLNDYSGKVVLVNFWASWCGPCRASTPHKVALANAYGKHGFEVLGVSLDTDLTKLRAFHKQSGMSWRHLCDQGGWDSKFAEIMDVRSIPATFLLDKQGRICAVDLQGMQLEGAIMAALAEE